MKANIKFNTIFIIAFFAMLSVIAYLSVNSSAAELTEIDGLKYTESENGNTKLYSGWTRALKSNKRFYYKNGKKLKNTWLTSNGAKKYFLTSDGSAATGKITIAGTEYEFDDKGKIVEDAWGITVEAKDMSSTGLTLITNVSSISFEWEFSYGYAFTVESYAKSTWQEPEKINSDIEFTDEAILLYEGATEEKYDWEDIYGKLPSGRYRLVKSITRKLSDDWKSPRESKDYYAYFTIE